MSSAKHLLQQSCRWRHIQCYCSTRMVEAFCWPPYYAWRTACSFFAAFTRGACSVPPLFLCSVRAHPEKCILPQVPPDPEALARHLFAQKTPGRQHPWLLRTGFAVLRLIAGHLIRSVSIVDAGPHPPTYPLRTNTAFAPSAAPAGLRAHSVRPQDPRREGALPRAPRSRSSTGMLWGQ